MPSVDTHADDEPDRFAHGEPLGAERSCPPYRPRHRVELGTRPSLAIACQALPARIQTGARSMRRDLRGQRILITGASSGIGRCLASQLAQAGCRLALAARSEDKLQTLAKSLTGSD